MILYFRDLPRCADESRHIANLIIVYYFTRYCK
jgi:hypothetical protein